MENQTKETDLLDLIKELFLFIGRLFKQTGEAFLWIFRFCVKHYIILGISFLLGVGLFFFLSSPKQRLYNNDYLLRVNISNSFILSDIIASLNDIQRMNNIQSFADTLKISLKTAKQIKKIQAFYIIDLNANVTPDYIDYKNKYKEIDVRNVRMQDRLCARFVTKSYVDTRELEQGLLYFLSSNEYLHKETETRNKIILENINVLDNEIAALDSLRKIEYATGGQLSLKMDNAIMLGERKTYHKEILDLVDRKESQQARILLRPNAISIDSPVKVTQRYSDILMFIVLTGGLLFIGFIIALFVDFRSQIIKALKG
jgi:hypothetical protein